MAKNRDVGERGFAKNRFARLNIGFAEVVETVIYVVSSKGLGREHQDVLDDWTEGESGEELQAADNQDDADEKTDEKCLVRGEGAGRG